ncbi:hypothetical protein [Marinicella sp. W31]|uniref:hypothetical protein n=1 Tax=Marinicella sp. W31 TaxID=3023713 RepID=UPI003757AC78
MKIFLAFIVILYAVLFLLRSEYVPSKTFTITYFPANDSMHEEVLQKLESKGFKIEIIADSQSPRILEAKTQEGEILSKISYLENRDIKLQLFSFISKQEISLGFSNTKNTYEYKDHHYEFLNYYCDVLKRYSDNDWIIKFYDFQPNNKMPNCYDLISTGKAVYININNLEKEN